MSSSLPRYSGDYSGSFIADFNTQLKRQVNAHTDDLRLHFFYLGAAGAQPARRHLSRTILVKGWFWPLVPRPWRGVLFHGGSKAGRSLLWQLWLWPFALLDTAGILAGWAAAVLIIRNRRYPAGRRSAQQPFILHSHFAVPAALLSALLPGRFTRICTLHSSGVHLLKKAGRAGNLLLTFICRRHNLVHASCQFIVDRLPGPCLARAVVQPLVPVGGVNTEPNRGTYQGIDAAVPATRVGFIGSLHEVKGIRPFLAELLAAVRRFESEGLGLEQPVIVEVTGRGKDGPAIARLADSINRQSDNLRVFFNDARVPKEEMSTALQQYDYILAPSKEANGFFEGVPVTAIEALQLQRPLLATDSGGIGELFKLSRPGIMAADQAELAAAFFSLPLPGSAEYTGFRQAAITFFEAGHYRQLARRYAASIAEATTDE